MRSAFATTVALFAGAVLAAIPGLPECSQTCITDYRGCNQVDVKCICTNKPLLDDLACCVGQKCQQSDIDKVIAFANSLCGSYGVTGLPKAATCAATESATAAPTATSESSATATATITSAPEASSTAAASSAATSAASSAAASAPTSAAASGTSSPSAAMAAPTNMAQNVLALGLGALGLLAAL